MKVKPGDKSASRLISIVYLGSCGKVSHYHRQMVAVDRKCQKLPQSQAIPSFQPSPIEWC